MKTIEITIQLIESKTAEPEYILGELRKVLRYCHVQSIRLSDAESVKQFQEKFGLPTPSLPQILDETTFEYRYKFLREELTEFLNAYEEGNLHDQADALIDLVYVAHGTALMMGLPWGKLWEEVQRANMSKVRATSIEQSKRGSTLDVVKPDDWVGPNFREILR